MSLHQGLLEQIVASGTVFSVLGDLQREYERRLIQSRIDCDTNKQLAGINDLELIEAAIEGAILKKIARDGHFER